MTYNGLVEESSKILMITNNISTFPEELFASDGFVDVTALCIQGKKRFNDWHDITRTKKVLIYLCEKLELPKSSLLRVKHGGAGDKHTYAHPMLALDIGRWISIDFEYKIYHWIEEWKLLDSNESRYRTAFREIERDIGNFDEESEICERLQASLGGKREVSTPVGRIDLLTETHVIEVKNVNNWKSAIGQVQCYHKYHRDHKMMVHLFGPVQTDLVSIITSMCKDFNIESSFELN